MKALGTALLVIAAALAAACGEGRAVFNVDVLSFLSTGDSLRRFSVPGLGISADSSVSHQFFLPPGFGSSTADSVSASASASVIDTSGSGSVAFDVFFAKTQGALFTGTPYLSASSGPLVPGDSVQMVPPTNVSLADSVFQSDTVWVGIRVHVSTNVGPNMAGRFRLNSLALRIVLQDKVF